MKVTKEFTEFGNIHYDCPKRLYYEYTWDNKKRKWVKLKTPL